MLIRKEGRPVAHQRKARHVFARIIGLEAQGLFVHVLVPMGTEHHRQHVFALAQKVSDVKAVVLHPLCVTGIRGGGLDVAHPPAVEVAHVVPQPRDGKFGALRQPVQHERAAHEVFPAHPFCLFYHRR